MIKLNNKTNVLTQEKKMEGKYGKKSHRSRKKKKKTTDKQKETLNLENKDPDYGEWHKNTQCLKSSVVFSI